MNREAFAQNYGTWSTFVDVLNHEFLQQTGRGMYAYITPMSACQMYTEFKNTDKSLTQFVQSYVRLHME